MVKGLAMGFDNNDRDYTGLQIGGRNRMPDQGLGVQLGGRNIANNSGVVQLGADNTSFYSNGAQFGLRNSMLDHSNGVQFGLRNGIGGESNGAQIGLWNKMVRSSNGLQVGALNQRDHNSKSFQIGLVNSYVDEQGSTKYSPLIGGSKPAHYAGWGATIAGAGVAAYDQIVRNGEGLETIISTISNLF